AFAVRVLHLPLGAAHLPHAGHPPGAHVPHHLRGLHALLLTEPHRGPEGGGHALAPDPVRHRRGHRPHPQGGPVAVRLRGPAPRPRRDHRIGPGTVPARHHGGRKG